jgi:hypothetical protein
MVAGSILPVAIHNNNIFFLFGKENELADTPGFSDFGGGMESGETPFTAALREGSEELTGFLGNKKEVEQMIKRNGGPYKLINKTYNIHMFLMDYDENLPKYYNYNHRFLWEKMDKNMLNDSKLFEKIEIQWFTPEQMRSRRSEFRMFYQDIINDILKDLPNIRLFMDSKSTKVSETQYVYKKKRTKYNNNKHRRSGRTMKQKGG